MRVGVRGLLAAVLVVFVTVAAAIGFVVLRSERPASSPPDAPEAAVPEPEAVAEIEEPSPAPPVRPVPRRPITRPTPAPKPPAVEAEPDTERGQATEDGGKEDDEQRRQQQEQQRRIDRKVAREMAQLCRKLHLTEEQMQAVEPAMQKLTTLLQGIGRLKERSRKHRAELLRSFEEQGLSADQKKALIRESEQQFVLESRPALIEAYDGGIEALGLLRPHLHSEQTERLDKLIEEIQEEKDRVLQQGRAHL